MSIRIEKKPINGDPFTEIFSFLRGINVDFAEAELKRLYLSNEFFRNSFDKLEGMYNNTTDVHVREEIIKQIIKLVNAQVQLHENADNRANDRNKTIDYLFTVLGTALSAVMLICGVTIAIGATSQDRGRDSETN